MKPMINYYITFRTMFNLIFVIANYFTAMQQLIHFLQIALSKALKGSPP